MLLDPKWTFWVWQLWGNHINIEALEACLLDRNPEKLLWANFRMFHLPGIR
jgi:hypothetical protein